MNRKYKSLIIIFITILFLINFFINSNILIKTFFDTTKLWFYNLFPSIFIFFIITDILNNYHFPYYLGKIFGKLVHKIYKLPKETTYIIVMSITSGFPGNSKLIKEQLDNNTITIYDANKLLTMTHFSNPIFLLYTVGINFFHDKKIGVFILISHYITNFIIGFLFRNTYHVKETKKNYALTKPVPFMNLLKTSISNTINILFNVYGIIIFFALLTKTINLYLDLNPYTNMLFNGILEITNGLNLLSILPISKIKAAMIATFIISFGGISIHMQVMSILNKYDINYYVYLISRILHAAISSFLFFILSLWL